MQRLYLDTSVFGGYFEAEFEVWTKRLFDRIRAEHLTVVVSDVVLFELRQAPKHVFELLDNLPKHQVEHVGDSQEAFDLANKYVAEKVVGRTSLQDCPHIAQATLHRVDALVSWNFKHIANLVRIRGYNAVNYREGHTFVEIRTPIELMHHGR